MSSPPPGPPRPSETSALPTEELPRTTDLGMTHIVCPHCGTANRLTRQTCVQCERDIAMLRVIANKARHHFNAALEHAERNRWDEAIVELRNCLDLDANHVSAWVVLGTCLAKLERFAEAHEAWRRALAVDQRFAKAHDYLEKVDQVPLAQRYHRRLRAVTLFLVIVLIVIAWHLSLDFRPDPQVEDLRRAQTAFREGAHGEASTILDELMQGNPRAEIAVPAQALLSAVNSEFDQALSEIQAAQEQHDWQGGIEACQHLLALNPSRSLAELVTQRRAQFAGRLAEAAAGEVAALMEGTASPEAVVAHLREVQGLMPTPLMRDEIGALAASAEAVAQEVRRQRFERALAQVNREMEGRASEAQLVSLWDMLPAWPDQTPLGQALEAKARQVVGEARSRWEEMRDEASPVEIRHFVTQVQSLLASAEASESTAQAVRANQPSLLDEHSRLAALSPLAALEASAEAALPRADFRAGLARAEELAGERSWAEILNTLRALDESPASESERERMASLRREAATGLFRRFLAADRKYERLEITDREARETVDTWETVVANAPDRLFSAAFRTDYCLFYAARAWEKLGDAAQARHLYERIVQEFPEGDHATAAQESLARLSAEAGGSQ